MKVLFVGNSKKDDTLALGKSIIKNLLELDLEVFVNEEVYHINNTKMINENNLLVIDFGVVLGGDGTILKFAREYHEHEIPIYGINLGRVGALATGELDNYLDDIKEIIKKNYRVEKHNSILCEIVGSTTKELYAFNDITIHRGDSLSLLGVDITFNNRLISPIYADGLLFSTSTGSSAYNQSARGPLLLNSTHSFVMTPICPQFLAFSSVVFSEEDEICLKVKNEHAFISVDGTDKVIIDSNDVIFIRKAKYNLALIKFDKEELLYSSIYKIAKSIYKE